MINFTYTMKIFKKPLETKNDSPLVNVKQSKKCIFFIVMLNVLILASLGFFLYVADGIPRSVLGTYVGFIVISLGYLLYRHYHISASKHNLIKEEESFLDTINLEDLYNSAPAGDILVEEKGTILDYNTRFEKKFLGHHSTLRQKNFMDIIAEEDHEALKRVMNRVLQNDTVEAVEFRFDWGAEVIAYIGLFHHTYPTPYHNKNKFFFLQIYNNAEQKSMQLRLIQSQKTQAMGQLAGGIAHDFNNLLTAMIGFCDLLLLRHSPGDQSFTDIMQIKQNANRAANLVRQLLAFSRQQTLQPRVIDITESLAELSILLQRLIGAGISLKMHHGKDLGLVRVDHGQFEQVIINLAVNARDAISGSGEILIKTENKNFKRPLTLEHDSIPAGQYILIEVIDNGCGIRPEYRDRIFDPFFSTKEIGSGTGLGLATVQGIVTQTGGYITVDSEVGIGTKFSIFLPRHEGTCDESPQMIDKTPNQKDLTGSGIILIVEDEDAVRIFSARALRDKGYFVVEASNGEEGLNCLRKMMGDGTPPELLITDVVMPLKDGPTLAQEALVLLPHLKVIFMSGYAEDAFRKKIHQDEEINFIPKPFSLKFMAQKVKEVFEKDAPSEVLRKTSA